MRKCRRDSIIWIRGTNEAYIPAGLGASIDGVHSRLPPRVRTGVVFSRLLLHRRVIPSVDDSLDCIRKIFCSSAYLDTIAAVLSTTFSTLRLFTGIPITLLSATHWHFLDATSRLDREAHISSHERTPRVDPLETGSSNGTSSGLGVACST